MPSGVWRIRGSRRIIRAMQRTKSQRGRALTALLCVSASIVLTPSTLAFQPFEIEEPACDAAENATCQPDGEEDAQDAPRTGVPQPAHTLDRSVVRVVDSTQRILDVVLSACWTERSFKDTSHRLIEHVGPGCLWHRSTVPFMWPNGPPLC